MPIARFLRPSLAMSLVLACGEPSDDRLAAFRDTQAKAQTDLLASTLARALASEANRTTLVDRMKYSSRQSHAIDLTTYVSRTVDDLELALPTSWDRVTWEATDDIVVTSVIPHSQTPSMDFSLDGFLSLTIGDVYSVGYRTNGSEILFLPTDRLQYPLLVIRKEATIPVEVGTVRRAIVRDRATVSTTEEEYNLTDRGTFRDGDDRASWDGAKTLSTLRDCATEQSTPQGDSVDNDVDDDGLLDSCEYQIAKAFRPRLMLDKDERYADRQTYWEVRRPDVGEELTQQGADRLRAQELWLFYALGYYYDGGRYGFSWHDGDSEFVVASVAPVGTEAGFTVDAEENLLCRALGYRRGVSRML